MSLVSMTSKAVRKTLYTPSIMTEFVVFCAILNHNAFFQFNQGHTIQTWSKNPYIVSSEAQSPSDWPVHLPVTLPLRCGSQRMMIVW